MTNIHMHVQWELVILSMEHDRHLVSVGWEVLILALERDEHHAYIAWKLVICLMEYKQSHDTQTLSVKVPFVHSQSEILQPTAFLDRLIFFIQIKITSNLYFIGKSIVMPLKRSWSWLVCNSGEPFPKRIFMWYMQCSV